METTKKNDLSYLTPQVMNNKFKKTIPVGGG